MKIKNYFFTWKMTLIAAIGVHSLFLGESLSEHLQLLVIDICLLLFLRNLSRLEKQEEQMKAVATLTCSSGLLGVAHLLILLLDSNWIPHALGLTGNILLVTLGYKCIWDGRGRDKDMILLFDGNCGFCHRAVKMVLRYNDLKNINFTPLQSNLGKELLSKNNLPQDYIESSVFISGEEIFLNENGGFRIARELNLFFLILYPFAMLVPRFISGRVYRWIANNRYNFFGPADNQCLLLDEETQKRFL